MSTSTSYDDDTNKRTVFVVVKANNVPTDEVRTYHDRFVAKDVSNVLEVKDQDGGVQDFLVTVAGPKSSAVAEEQVRR